LKFTEKGTVRLKVTVPADMRTVNFEIIDTGVGIREEDIPKLFSAFSQADTSKNRTIVGTGLGLAISKSFVEMMGGEITIASVYGRGTTMTITIPLVPGDAARVRADDLTHKQSFFAPGADVLVVDDNEFNLKVAHGLMALLKIDAETVFSGKEAIDRVQERDFDIVFMDHMMPEMDGIETTVRIRALGGRFTDIPIIALTANAIAGAKDMFLANGFNDFVSKPINSRELSTVLEQWLPPEKIDRDIEQEAESAKTAQSEFFGILNQIDEINTQIGLQRFSGIDSMYRDTTEVFFKRLLKDTCRMRDSLNTGDLADFSISVHAMKSALSTIGAMTMSETALKLEMASKEMDIAFCEQHFPEFMDKLILLREKLLPAFPNNSSSADKEQGDPALLKEKVHEALKAADRFSSDTGVKLMNELLAYEFGEDINTILENALTSFDEFDCDAAVEYLNGIKCIS
jgi:CheY-like chemotaxis protein/HPt (histidine-containing phosphotransfer) domain-containing protein